MQRMPGRHLGWCFVLLCAGSLYAADLQITDNNPLAIPTPGAYQLRVLTPYWLELTMINTKPPDPAHVDRWDFVDDQFVLHAPALSNFVVRADNEVIAASAIGFRRRPLYAPLQERDLRIQNGLFLRLQSPIAEGQTVRVENASGTLWPSNMQFTAVMDPLRLSPAIHVNQEGYLPGFSKKAMVGYYLGNLGELDLTGTSTFTVVNATNGTPVYNGTLAPRPDVGYTYQPTPYQKVLEADFTGLMAPGQYRLMVPGLGVSHPFVIDEGIALGFARAYALGLYHQRCGTSNALPYTRFVHAPCHTAPAEVPVPASFFQFTWDMIADYTIDAKDNPRHTAPPLTNPSTSRFPLLRKGQVDVSGGHHDAGDYSKYTVNSAALVHYLLFAVDSLPGVAALDNLGLPESGDGVSDLLQEAKWEADFLARLQDTDGGFYFLVYPREREYETDVLPEDGDAQVVWPKTTAVTAAAVAALAQAASSPRFKAQFPAESAAYLQKAHLGWQFLTNALARFGKDGAYQKITHHGDTFMHDDELAWAACEMFLATGDSAYHQRLLTWFNPINPDTWQYGWHHMFEAYGCAIRSYARAADSGRLPRSRLNPTFLARCEQEIRTAGTDALRWARQNAYGTSFPEETKRFFTAGWYFSSDQAFDIAVAYQLDPRPDYLEAILSNLNYEAGCNPVNVSFITGLGWKRQREVVAQYALNDRRMLAPSGLPLGNIQSAFSYLYNYPFELTPLCFPSDDAEFAPYPFYDRWTDTFNVTTEYTTQNQVRSLACLAFLATLTAAHTQAWSSATARITTPTNPVRVGLPVTVSLQTPGLDISNARVVWEARGQEPSFGVTDFTFTPTQAGPQWVEMEGYWPDGRRIFVTGSFTATNQLATVSVAALDASAVEGSRDPARLVFQRTGPLGQALTFYFEFAGMATAFEDFTSSAGEWQKWLTFPPGANAIVLELAPTDDHIAEGTERVELSLVPNSAAYTVGSPDRASFRIQDNDFGLFDLIRSPQGITLVWLTRAGRSYQVFYKDSLGQPEWLTLSGTIPATGPTLSWSDLSAGSVLQRFYQVVELP